MKTASIREEVLRDPRYPVHRIADRLLPYLKVLVEQFHPEQEILFGSYAYGNPDEHSDVDLLVVNDCPESSLKRRIQIRDAWWKMPRKEHLLPFELLLVSPAEHEHRLAQAGGFYATINRDGLLVA